MIGSFFIRVVSFLGKLRVVYCSPPPFLLIFYHPRRTFFLFFNLASNFPAGRTFLIWLLCKRLEMLAEAVWDSSKNVKSCAGAVICWSVCVRVCVSPSSSPCLIIVTNHVVHIIYDHSCTVQLMNKDNTHILYNHSNFQSNRSRSSEHQSVEISPR